ncbi:hypothetical protein PR048_029537 [Dryococelus australis]|uniref:Uncharacterized protein n=1 Tax=Dryococelus australis TaxID=614101 RepID=A0ABQ9GDM4_9NEOP|nr:hypothetical protein PR048_029537 [Dryococelus australis]
MQNTFRKRKRKKGSGGAVIRLPSPPPHMGEPGSIPGGRDFRMWESCRTMRLVDGFSRGSSVPPPFHYGAAPHSLHFTLIGSQDLAVKSRPKSLHSTPRKVLKVDFKSVRGRGGRAVGLLASHQGEPGFNPQHEFLPDFRAMSPGGKGDVEAYLFRLVPREIRPRGSALAIRTATVVPRLSRPTPRLEKLALNLSLTQIVFGDI